jgi:hypothetical protein
VVRTAALPLPAEHRWGYRQEFLAELYGMTPAEQRHHAIGGTGRRSSRRPTAQSLPGLHPASWAKTVTTIVAGGALTHGDAVGTGASGLP